MNNTQKNLRIRAGMTRALREFFHRYDFIEVTTPVKIHAPAPEEFIESVRSENDFLRTSPELAMKVLLADGWEKIYQIGPCFRANEHGRKHKEEFTMLEFYSAGTDYLELARFTAEMIAASAADTLGGTWVEYRGHAIDLAESEFVTVAEAFARYTGVSMEEADRTDCFDELMVTKIEPELGKDKLTFLCDYPANRAALSRLKADDPVVAERWELYIAGLELANAFGELTDAAEQKKRFETALAFRAAAGMHAYPRALEFYEALDRGLPASSGCALGLDRLAMIFTGSDDIAAVTVG